MILKSHQNTALDALLNERNELLIVLERTRGVNAPSKPMRIWLTTRLLEVVTAADAFADELGRSDELALNSWQNESARMFIAMLPDLVLPELKVVKNKPSDKVAVDETGKRD